MSLFNFLKPKKQKTLPKDPSQTAQVLHNIMNSMCESGCDTDEMPQGQGEFGLSVTNPIPTHTPIGSNSYLDRLHTSDGDSVAYDRMGSTSAPIIVHPIDQYLITNSSGEQIATLYISPYHKRNSNKAPKGFTLL